MYFCQVQWTMKFNLSKLFIKEIVNIMVLWKKIYIYYGVMLHAAMGYGFKLKIFGPILPTRK